uniref:Uncharacterized protein n=1 Tax=Medicago truncatula TaxID=3880 RepID=I3S524_MEDTR|nr:unknown [Medicago truncatula]
MLKLNNGLIFHPWRLILILTSGSIQDWDMGFTFLQLKRLQLLA